MKTLLMLILVLVIATPVFAQEWEDLFNGDEGDKIWGAKYIESENYYELVSPDAFIDLRGVLTKRHDTVIITFNIGTEDDDTIKWNPFSLKSIYFFPDEWIINDQSMTWYDVPWIGKFLGLKIPLFFKHYELPTYIRNVMVWGRIRAVGVPNEKYSVGNMKNRY